MSDITFDFCPMNGRYEVSDETSCVPLCASGFEPVIKWCRANGVNFQSSFLDRPYIVIREEFNTPDMMVLAKLRWF